MSKVSVLIVGAGPTGLFMAYQLARHGILFRIIDKKSQQTENSNAAALQTRTLEIFRHLGIADDFIREGQSCNGVNLYDKGKAFAFASFLNLKSIYHYILTLPQYKTEKILNEKLVAMHHRVERTRELIDINASEEEIEATIQHADGVKEIIRCEWLLGCDGAHSTTREKCGLSFPGKDLDSQFLVADGALNTFLPKDQLHVFSDSGLMLAIFPLGDDKYRLAANLDSDSAIQHLTEDDIKALVHKRSSGKFDAKSISWISPFWIHSKLADKMRHGNVFLLGDAAHIHSPVGGQGMNTGLQDVHNLAWKLALVIQERADIKLLDSYQDERYPVIKDVVETTERSTKMLLIKNPVMLCLRKYIIKLILSIPMTASYLTERLTQLSIRYHKSCALAESSQGGKGPLVGERAPDIKISSTHNFYDSLNDNKHHIICFTGGQDIFNMADTCKQISQELMGPYKDVLMVHLITPHIIDEQIDQICDESHAMHDLYCVKKPSVIVVRPDGVISYQTNNTNITNLKQFFMSYLKAS